MNYNLFTINNFIDCNNLSGGGGGDRIKNY